MLRIVCCVLRDVYLIYLCVSCYVLHVGGYMSCVEYYVLRVVLYVVGRVVPCVGCHIVFVTC